MEANTSLNTFCSLPWKNFKVDCEGNVTMCCFQERKCLGNILESSLEDIWNSNLAEEIRQQTANGALHPSCQTISCPFLQVSTPRKSETVWRLPFPVSWEIDMPSQHCNIGGENPSEKNPACLMCERHLWYEPQMDRLREVCARLRPYIQHVRTLHIQGIAEAFWKDYLFEILDWLDFDNHKDHICVSTTTNGTIFHEPRRRRWLRCPTSILTFSVDAATPETYELIRRVPLYHRVVDNLLAYSRERSPWQQLRIHNNINLLNIKEVEGMVELAARARAAIDFNPTYSVPFIAVDKSNAYLFKEAEEKIVAAANRLGVKATFMRKMTLDHNPDLQFKQPFIPMNTLLDAATKLAIPVSKLIEAKPSNTEVLVSNL